MCLAIVKTTSCVQFFSTRPIPLLKYQQLLRIKQIAVANRMRLLLSNFYLSLSFDVKSHSHLNCAAHYHPICEASSESNFATPMQQFVKIAIAMFPNSL